MGKEPPYPLESRPRPALRRPAPLCGLFHGAIPSAAAPRGPSGAPGSVPDAEAEDLTLGWQRGSSRPLGSPVGKALLKPRLSNFPRPRKNFGTGQTPKVKKFWNGPDPQSKKSPSPLPLPRRSRSRFENARRPGGCPSRCVKIESSLIRLQFNIDSNSNRIRLKFLVP